MKTESVSDLISAVSPAPETDSGKCYFCLFVRGFLKRFYLLFLERGREGEREGEKHQCVGASSVPPTGDLAHNPGMCSD